MGLFSIVGKVYIRRQYIVFGFVCKFCQKFTSPPRDFRKAPPRPRRHYGPRGLNRSGGCRPGRRLRARLWVSDQSSDQVDQDGATGTPCQEAGISAYRGVGDQGDAERDSGTDRSASAGTWLACFESNRYLCRWVNRLPQGSELGRGRRFWTFALLRRVVTL